MESYGMDSFVPNISNGGGLYHSLESYSWKESHNPLDPSGHFPLHKSVFKSYEDLLNILLQFNFQMKLSISPGMGSD